MGRVVRTLVTRNSSCTYIKASDGFLVVEQRGQQFISLSSIGLPNNFVVGLFLDCMSRFLMTVLKRG